MIRCLRIGFNGRSDDTPDHALSVLLQRMEANGHLVVSVSVLRPGSIPGERYEAYIVTRHGDDADGDQ